MYYIHLSQSRGRYAMRLLGRIMISNCRVHTTFNSINPTLKLVTLLFLALRLRTDAEAHSNDEGWQGH